jgi:hypothetical protein
VGVIEPIDTAKQLKPIDLYPEIAPDILSIMWKLGFQPLVITIRNDEVNIIAMLSQPIILHRHSAEDHRLVEELISQSLNMDYLLKFKLFHWFLPVDSAANAFRVP